MLSTQYGKILCLIRGFERNDASVSYRTVSYNFNDGLHNYFPIIDIGQRYIHSTVSL